MKLKQYSNLFIILVFSLVHLINTQYEMLEKVSQNEFGKSILDLIAIKHESADDDSNTDIVADLQSILLSLQNEYSEKKQHNENLKRECKERLLVLADKVNDVKVKTMTWKEKTESKEQMFIFHEQYEDKILKLSEYLTVRREINAALNKDLRGDNNISEMKLILSEFLDNLESNFQLSHINQINFTKNLKTKLNEADDNFYKLIIKNVIRLLEDPKLNKNVKLSSIFALIKKTKKLLKNRLNTNDHIDNEALLQFESTKHKLDLEIGNTNKELEVLQRDVQSISKDLNELKKNFSFFDEEKKQIEILIEIIEKRCNEDLTTQQEEIKDKKNEVTIAKLLKEFSLKEFSKVIEYVKKREKINSNSNSDEDEEEEDFY